MSTKRRFKPQSAAFKTKVKANESALLDAINNFNNNPSSGQESKSKWSSINPEVSIIIKFE